MAKLYLKFEQAVLKEVPLAHGNVTIGRLPDNLIQVDNLAVSGHHVRIYWETDHYVVEDLNSLNGTYLNNRRISKNQLKDGDEILVGKHVIAFKDEWHEESDAASKTVAMDAPVKAPAPSMGSTMVLDTKKAKEMMAAAAAARAGGGAPAPAGGSAAASGGGSAPAQQAPEPPPSSRERIGSLTILEGKTDQKQYVLSSKMTVIGKSDMASIRLKGWFAPKMAALINKRDNKYFVAASEKDIKVVVNGEKIAGQKELSDGDMIEVAGVKMSFGYND